MMSRLETEAGSHPAELVFRVMEGSSRKQKQWGVWPGRSRD